MMYVYSALIISIIIRLRNVVGSEKVCVHV